MADTKISALSALTAPAIDDEYVVVDKSDTTMAASGTDKKIAHQTLVSETGKSRFLPPTGVTFENFSRLNTTAGSVSPTSGTMRLAAIWLPAGFSVTSISFMSVGGLTLGTSVNFWVALFDSSLNLLRQSTTDTAPTWAATTMKTTNLSSAFATTYTGLHYAGINLTMTGGSVPTYLAMTVTASIHNLAPSLSGASSTGLTGTAPNPAAAITAGATNIPWCGVA